MTYELEIPIATLRRASQILLQHLEELEGDSVTVGDDYFWSIPTSEQYDVSRSPQDLTVGQLSETMGHLDSFVADPDSSITYGLVWLSDVLRAVGQKGIR